MTAPSPTTTLAALIAGAMADLSTAGIAADYLEENGDSRGVMLRKRWEIWQADRQFSEEVDREWSSPPFCVDVDDADFRKYLYRRFPEARPALPHPGGGPPAASQ